MTSILLIASNPNNSTEMITKIVSSISCFVSFGALILAGISFYFTFRLRQEELRLKLYDKRFEVYLKIMNYVIVYHNLKRDEFENWAIKKDFIAAFRTSKFLFKKNSKIYELIKDIQNDCSFINENFREKDEHREEALRKAELLEKKKNDLEDLMLDYLQFEQKNASKR